LWGGDILTLHLSSYYKNTKKTYRDYRSASVVIIVIKIENLYHGA